MLTSSSFADEESQIKQINARNVVLEFTADWCGGCREISPMVSKLEREGFPVQQVDVDKHPQLMKRMGVELIPCFVLLVDGKIKHKEMYSSGSQFKSTLQNMFVAATNGREKHLAKFKSLRDLKGKRKSLDGSEGPGLVSNSTDIRLVSDTPAKKPFNFPSFGLGGREEKSVGVAAPRPRQKAATKPATKAAPQTASTVRIRVKDPKGTNFGTGTVIFNKQNHALVLTCGHIFRELKQGEEIEVDTFANGQLQTVNGKLLKFDEKSDLGLMVIPTNSEIPLVSIASLRNTPAVKQKVFSIGCGNGELPTTEHMQVTSLNRYEGPDSIECTRMPAQGRSGGGLFNNEGELIGVCILAQPIQKRGIYTGLKPIYQLLDECRLSFVHPASVNSEVKLAVGSEQENRNAPVEQPLFEKQLPTVGGANPTSPNTQRTTDGSNPELRLLQEALAQSGDAEIVCLVRSKNDPHGEPRIVLINKASQKLMGYLKQDPQPNTLPAMHQVPNQSFGQNTGTQQTQPQERYLPSLSEEDPFGNSPVSSNSPWGANGLAK